MTSPQIYVGIDPGQQGAMAFLDADGRLLAVVDLPVLAGEPLVLDFQAMLLAHSATPVVGIEEPFANNRASSISQMNQGMLYGCLLGVIQANELTVERIRPQNWKSEMSIPMGSKYSPKEKKEMSRKRANELWPAHQELWAAQKHHDRAEAALIGECLRRRVVGR